MLSQVLFLIRDAMAWLQDRGQETPGQPCPGDLLYSTDNGGSKARHIPPEECKPTVPLTEEDSGVGSPGSWGGMGTGGCRGPRV